MSLQFSSAVIPRLPSGLAAQTRGSPRRAQERKLVSHSLQIQLCSHDYVIFQHPGMRGLVCGGDSAVDAIAMTLVSVTH